MTSTTLRRIEIEHEIRDLNEAFKTYLILCYSI